MVPFRTKNNFKRNNLYKKASHTNNSSEKPLYKQFYDFSMHKYV